MTKRDYIRIAACLKAAGAKLGPEPLSMGAYLDAIDRLAVMLKADNPAFDRARFLAACGSVPSSWRAHIRSEANA